MTRPLSVDVVLPVGGLGGAESMLFSLLDHQRHRLDLRFVALGESPISAAVRERGGPLVVLPTGKRPVDLARSAVTLARRWRRDGPDVVLANSVKCAAVAVPAGRLVGLPVVWMKHDLFHDRPLAAPLGRLSTAVVANSALTARATRRRDAVLVPPPRPDAAPLPRADARHRLEEAGLPADAFPVVACVGRLLPYKGVDDVVAALARPEAGDWHLVVIGEDDAASPGERSRLERLADQAGVAERVSFLGRVPEVGTVLPGVEAVAVTTRPGPTNAGGEGWSIVVDEAMAAGVAVIASRGGAPTERLGGAGAAVDPGSPAQVAEALARLADPATRATMGEEGRKIVAAAADLPTCASRLVSVLAGAANRPGAGLEGPPITVVVPVRNEADAIEASFEAVAAQLGDGDEVVYVHDPSTDGTGEILDRLVARGDRFRVLHRDGTRRGISAARNAGVAVAAHHRVACTDVGCRPRPGWLAGLRAAFAEPDPPDLVTGLYEPAVTGPVDEAFALSCYPVVDEARRQGPWGRLYGLLLGRVFDPTLPTGRSMAFTREAWSAVGGFPEDLATAEDVGFGRSVAAAGHRTVLAADAVVTWDQRPSLAATARMYHGYGVGDGESGDPLLVGRNLARVIAYGLGPILAWRGGISGRAAVATGAGVYLSVPLARAARRRSTPLVWALIPAALAVKDLAKALGCLSGIVRSRS